MTTTRTPAPDAVFVTADYLRQHDACPGGLALFESLYPDGLLYDPTDVVLCAALCASPLAKHLGWAVTGAGLPAMRPSVGDRGTATAGDRGTATAGFGGTATAGDRGTVTAGDRGTATAGDRGTATAGDRGTATAGFGGTATAGDRGTATAGDRGTATAGDYGTATAGDYGTATAGDYGTATAGAYGSLAIRWYDTTTRRYRLAAADVGLSTDRDGQTIQAGVPYKVDDAGRFYRA